MIALMASKLLYLLLGLGVGFGLGFVLCAMLSAAKRVDEADK